MGNRKQDFFLASATPGPIKINRATGDAPVISVSPLTSFSFYTTLENTPEEPLWFRGTSDQSWTCCTSSRVVVAFFVAPVRLDTEIE